MINDFAVIEAKPLDIVVKKGMDEHRFEMICDCGHYESDHKGKCCECDCNGFKDKLDA